MKRLFEYSEFLWSVRYGITIIAMSYAFSYCMIPYFTAFVYINLLIVVLNLVLEYFAVSMFRTWYRWYSTTPRVRYEQRIVHYVATGRLKEAKMEYRKMKVNGLDIRSDFDFLVTLLKASRNLRCNYRYEIMAWAFMDRDGPRISVNQFLGYKVLNEIFEGKSTPPRLLRPIFSLASWRHLEDRVRIDFGGDLLMLTATHNCVDTILWMNDADGGCPFSMRKVHDIGYKKLHRVIRTAMACDSLAFTKILFEDVGLSPKYACEPLRLRLLGEGNMNDTVRYLKNLTEEHTAMGE